MRKTSQFLLAAGVVVLLIATVVLYAKYKDTSSVVAGLRIENDEAQTRYGEAINEIAAIQDSLNAIVLGDDETVPLASTDFELERRLTETGGDRALAHIERVKAGIRRAKDRIEQLDADLKARGVKISGLEKMIAGLRGKVADKEAQVERLAVRVDSLQSTVVDLVAQTEENQEMIRMQSDTIEAKERELHTVYYKVGTKSDLTRAGLVVARGGVLGIGKTLEPSGHVDESLFSTLNAEAEGVIRIPSTKVEVLSAQPVTSYELEVVGSETELRILDPKEFSKVKHLLIMTT